MKNFLILIAFLISILIANGQNLDKPNFAIASHPLYVEQLRWSPKAFIMELVIENQAKHGSFCADKNIYIKDLSTNTKYYLIRSEGIPVCPQSYHFKFVGETLHFLLYFPPLSPKVKYINLVENCDNHCFSILGIIISRKMNYEINKGFDFFADGNFDFAYSAFKQAIDNNPNYPYGFLYAHIIKVLIRQNKIKEAKKWFTKLKISHLADKKDVLKQIEKEEDYKLLIN